MGEYTYGAGEERSRRNQIKEKMEAGVGRQSLEFFLAGDNMVAGAFVGCPWFRGGADLHAHHLSLSYHSFPEYMMQSRPPRFRGRPGDCTS